MKWTSLLAALETVWKRHTEVWWRTSSNSEGWERNQGEEPTKHIMDYNDNFRSFFVSWGAVCCSWSGLLKKIRAHVNCVYILTLYSAQIQDMALRHEVQLNTHTDQRYVTSLKCRLQLTLGWCWCHTTWAHETFSLCHPFSGFTTVSYNAAFVCVYICTYDRVNDKGHRGRQTDFPAAEK